MLSDSCSDFLETLCSGEHPAKEAIKLLAREVEHYADEYDNGEIPQLRAACIAAFYAPAGASASRSAWLAPLVRLILLAEQIRAYHDTPPRLRVPSSTLVAPDAAAETSPAQARRRE